MWTAIQWTQATALVGFAYTPNLGGLYPTHLASGFPLFATSSSIVSVRSRYQRMHSLHPVGPQPYALVGFAYTPNLGGLYPTHSASGFPLFATSSSILSVRSRYQRMHNLHPVGPQPYPHRGRNDRGLHRLRNAGDQSLPAVSSGRLLFAVSTRTTVFESRLRRTII
jgi:hypothetical protein